MRYILDDLGYIEEVSSNLMECNDKGCTAYSGTIPEGYDSLEEWAMNANIRAYKIVNNNLTYDADRDAELQEEFNAVGNEVVITTTNEAPKKAGEWILIDKEFTPATGTGAINRNTTNATSITTNWSRSGHSISMSLQVVNKVNYGETNLQIGTLNLAALGISKFVTAIRMFAFTDGGNCFEMWSLGENGVIDHWDTIPDSYVSNGNNNYSTFTAVLTMNEMLDSACNKFYWRRKKEGE